MPDRLVLWTIAGFALVVGSMALVRLRRRRVATSIDDASILLAAPPEGMTPAVAALVDGAPTRLAFMAALLDLASRGEIGFAAESVTQGIADVGVPIGGGDATDARVEQNRRQPAGEAEAWLLGQLELAAGHRRHAPWDADAMFDRLVPPPRVAEEPRRAARPSPLNCRPRRCSPASRPSAAGATWDRGGCDRCADGGTCSGLDAGLSRRGGTAEASVPGARRRARLVAGGLEHLEEEVRGLRSRDPVSAVDDEEGDARERSATAT